MNWTACDVIRSYLTQNLKYHVMTETSVRKIWEILESKYLTKGIENSLASQEEVLPPPVEEEDFHR